MRVLKEPFAFLTFTQTSVRNNNVTHTCTHEKTLQQVNETYFTLTPVDIYTIVSHLGGI